MKRFKDFYRESQEKVLDKDLVGYATLRKHPEIDKLIGQINSPEELIGYASIRNHPEVDALIKKLNLDKANLNESYTTKYTTELSQYNKNPEPGNSSPWHPDPVVRTRQVEASAEEMTDNLIGVGHHEDVDFDSPNTHHHVSQYTEASHSINKALINLHATGKELTDKNKRSVSALDRETTKPELAFESKVTAYSGVGEEMARNLAKAKPGQIVHFPAYTSTSIQHESAIPFGSRISHTESGVPGFTTKGMKEPKKVRHMAVFHLPKGYHKGRYVESLTQNPEEHEIILARNQKFKLKEQRFDPHKAIVYHHFEPHQE